MLSAVRAAALVWAITALDSPAGAEIGDLAADTAVGQSSFTDAEALPIGAATFALPKGLAIDRSVTPNRAYVSDGAHHRVLGWRDADKLTNGALPGSAVTPAATLTALCDPRGLAVDRAGTLYVATPASSPSATPSAPTAWRTRCSGGPGGSVRRS